MRKLAIPTMMAVVLNLVISSGWATAQPGSLDPSWGENGLSGSVSGVGRVAAVADDGRVYLSGQVAAYQNGQQIVAYDATGALDPSFAPVALPGQSHWDEWRVAVQPTTDGHRLLALNRGRIHGLTASGVSDSTFGQNGVVTPASTVAGGDVDIEVAEGGERIVHLSTARRWTGAVTSAGVFVIVVVGAGTEASGFVLSAFDENGAPDRSFGAASVSGADTPGGFACLLLCKVAKVSFVPKDVEIGSDGSVYVGGRVISQTTQVETTAAIIKFRRDGSLDDSFGERGLLLGGPLGESSDLTALAEQPGEGLLAAVRRCEWDGWRHQCWTSNDIRRLTPEGALDTTFGEGGMTPLSQPVHGLDQIEVTADGRHIIAIQDQVDHETPETQEPVLIVRLTAQGAVDTTFGSDGAVQLSTGGRGALDQTGRIYIPGSVHVSYPEYAMHVARYQAAEGDGSTDPSPTPTPTPTVALVTVKGDVYNEKTYERIAGAFIACEEYTAATAEDGSYEMKIAPGTYHCTISADGYHDGKFRRDFKSSCGCYHDFWLRPRR